MPFDALPERVAEDVLKLRVARDGVGTKWTDGEIGLEDEQHHCAIGWLLVASEWNEAEATRLALDYVYPALPEKAKRYSGRIESIYKYNDAGGKKRVLDLFNAAIALAEKAHAG